MKIVSSFLHTILVFTSVVFCSSSTQALNILFKTGLGEPGSHFYTGSIIAETLVRRGHNVTYIISDAFGTDRVNSSLGKLFNFEMYPSAAGRNDTLKGRTALGVSSIKGGRVSAWGRAKMWWFRGRKEGGFKDHTSVYAAECDSALSDVELMKRLRDTKFDIMVGDVLYPCYILIAQKLNLPYVNVVNGPNIPMVYDRLAGAPANPAFTPGYHTTFPEDMTLLQRCLNLIIFGLTALIHDNFFLGPLDRLKVKHDIQPDMSLYQSIGRAEIWLMNTDVLGEYPRALTPNSVYIGGITIAPAKPLQTDLKNFVEGSGDQGIVIFSLSSSFNTLDVKQSDEIAAALARLSQRVVWKYEGKPPSRLGNNTKLVSWLPMSDLLGHPKTRLMINHAGMNSMYDAVYFGVPMICIPLFGNQFSIYSRIAKLGFAKRVDITTMTRETLYQAALEVLNNDRYKANAMKWSRIQQDQLTPPRERAAHWIEHVSKYGGDYLRPRSLDLNFIQLHCIDVLIILTIVAFTAALVVYYALRIMCRLVCWREKSGKVKNE